MKALVFDIRVNSLYSIRIPFTWQSALTYPVLPPSAVIGLIANALQRCKNDKPPLKYLDLVESNILWAGSRLLTPCVIKSYTTSVITIFGGKGVGEKFTNVLGRQYAYSKKLQGVAIFKNDALISDIVDALKTSPLTCGDSESLANIEKLKQLNVKSYQFKPEEIIETEYHIPMEFNKIEIIKGIGRLYLIHERCKKTAKEFPLKSCLYPIEETNGILIHSKIIVRIKKEVSGYEIEDIGKVITDV